MNCNNTIRTNQTLRSVRVRPFSKDFSTKKVGTAIYTCLNFCLPRQQTSFLLESSGYYSASTVLVPYFTSRCVPTRFQDFFPMTGSIFAPGLAARIGLYREYRIFSSKMIVTFVNLEMFPVLVFVCSVTFGPVALFPLQSFSNLASVFHTVALCRMLRMMFVVMSMFRCPDICLLLTLVFVNPPASAAVVSPLFKFHGEKTCGDAGIRWVHSFLRGVIQINKTNASRFLH